MPLSDVFVKNAKSASKGKKYADGEGLFLFVTSNGTKSWRFRYRDILGKEQEMVLGSYPSKSLLEVRKERFEARQLLANGKDPKEEKRKKTRETEQCLVNTFEAVAKDWYDLRCDQWSFKRRQKIWNRLKNHVFPVFGKRPITSFDEFEFLEKIIRKVERQGHTDLAHEIVNNCSAIFRHARRLKKIAYNPLSDFTEILKRNKRKNLPRIGIHELPELLNALEITEASKIDKLAIELLLLTFVRTQELRMSKWEQFDIKKRIWVIPAHVMKKKRDHIVPLSRQAINVLTEIAKISNQDAYLFPTKKRIKKPYMNENVINTLLHDMGYQKRHCGHGFRSLASTTLNELAWYNPNIIEKQLAHEKRDKTEDAYNKAEYLPQRIDLMQRWADYIDQVVTEDKIKQQKNAA
jgi:integrase